MYMSTSWCMSMSMPTSMSGVYACSIMFTLMCVLRVHIERHTHTDIYIKNIYIYNCTLQSMHAVCMHECVCENLPGTWEQRVTPFVFHTTSLQGDGGVAGELRPPKLAPATQENVPASPRCGQLAGHSLSLTFHFISCYVIPLCLT